MEWNDELVVTMSGSKDEEAIKMIKEVIKKVKINLNFFRKYWWDN